MSKFIEVLKEEMEIKNIGIEVISSLTGIDALSLERCIKGKEEFKYSVKKRICEIFRSDKLESNIISTGFEKIRDIKQLNNIKLSEMDLLNKLKEELKEGIEAIDILLMIKNKTISKSNSYKEASKDDVEESIYQINDILYWITTSLTILIQENGFEVDEIKEYMDYKFKNIKEYIK